MSPIVVLLILGLFGWLEILDKLTITGLIQFTVGAALGWTIKTNRNGNGKNG